MLERIIPLPSPAATVTPGGLSVAGPTTLTGDVSAQRLAVADDLTASGGMVVSNGLTVTGGATIDTLTLTGGAGVVFNSLVTANGGIFVPNGGSTFADGRPGRRRLPRSGNDNAGHRYHGRPQHRADYLFRGGPRGER